MEPAAMSIIPHMKPALYRAAMAGTLEDYDAAVEQMPQEAVNRQVAPNGNTVLHVAVLHGNKHFVQKILQRQRAHASASLYALNDKKETVLHCAAEKGNADMVSVLINAIQDPESGATVKEMIHMTDDVNDMALHKAARMGHLGVVKLLIQEDTEFAYPTNDAGETPIYLAAESHHLYCLKEMIEKCQNLTYVGPFRRNALHAAILSSPSGSAWEIMNEIFLTLDIYLLFPDMIRIVPPSSWKNVVQKFRRYRSKAGCIELLLEKEISLCEMRDNLGWTPLHYAVKLGDDETVRKILEKKSSAAFIRAGIDNDDWTTIFHIAARHGNIKTMRCISNSLPDCWAMINCKSQNVLHEAILNRRRNMIKYILKHPQIDNLVYQKDNDGNTPLHLFGISGWTDSDFEYLVARFKREHLVFNKRHQTTLDMHHVASQHEVYSSAFMHVYGGIPQRSGRRSGPRADFLQNQETSREDIDKNIDKEINGYLRISKTMTLVATLILTLSFAAGFTVPGGYDSTKGYPILLGNEAFGFFVMLDTVAFTSSVSAIFIYMIMVWLSLWFSTRERAIVEALCLFNVAMTFLALIAVVVAFFSGMYAILAPFNSLAVDITFLNSDLFLFLFFLFFNHVKNSTGPSVSLCLIFSLLWLTFRW